MTDHAQLSQPTPVFEGSIKFADSSVISLQCFEGRCRECPDQTPDGEEGPGLLDGHNCEHGCGHGPIAGPAAAPAAQTRATAT